MRTTSAGGSTIGSAPLDAIGAAETHRAPIFVAPAIGNGPAFACGLHSGSRFGRVGQLALQPDAAPRRIQHLEQSFVEGLRPRIGGPLSDALPKIARSGLDG